MKPAVKVLWNGDTQVIYNDITYLGRKNPIMVYETPVQGWIVFPEGVQVDANLKNVLIRWAKE